MLSCPPLVPASTRGLRVLTACLAGLQGLYGCTGLDLQASTGAMLLGALLLLTLPLCAWLAYALGALRAQQRWSNQLRSTREALRQAEQLRGGWTWQTDASNRLLAWCGPGQTATRTCALFDPPPADGVLHGRLQSGLPFSNLRLRCAEPLDGSMGWDLRGVPRLDETGAFAGFVGSARPTDDDDDLRLAARALTPLLAANPLPALLAVRAVQGWTVRQANAAAQALWPAIAPGGDLDDVLAQLPADLGAAVARLTQAGVHTVQGWQLSAIGPLAGGTLALVLSRKAPDPAAARSDAAQDAQESDAFIFTLSHDLRSPIRAVDGFTRIVKEDYGHHLDRVGHDHLDRVLGAAARMNLMIDAMLGLARLSRQPLAQQRVNLSQLAGYVLDDLRRAEPERAVDCQVEPDLAAWGDPTLLRLVLENLLGNAWKYTGRCTQAQIRLGSVPHGDKAAFFVRDNGAGFDMRSADRLFGLFQRLHSANDFPGHGVGLASVRRIVQRHGGHIWAEAEPGRGAAFYFTLPG